MAIIILKSYRSLKKETAPEFARQVLLENIRQNGGNVKKTAHKMGCSRNTIYLALAKEGENDLRNKPHTPKTPHPRKTEKDVISLILKRRKETGFGKRRPSLRDGILLPESTSRKDTS